MRLSEAQRFDQDRVDDSEDRRARPDSQGERDDSSRCEARCASQDTQRIPDVLPDLCHGLDAYHSMLASTISPETEHLRLEWATRARHKSGNGPDHQHEGDIKGGGSEGAGGYVRLCWM